MIELYDRERLLPRRDRTLQLAGGVLLLGVALMGLRGWSLQEQRNTLRQESARLTQTEAKRSADAAVGQAPTPAMLADLRRTAERLEAETALPSGAGADLAPSQWLTDLAGLSDASISISKAEIGRSGAAVIEGQARHSEAITEYMRRWEQHPQLGRLAARGLDIREDTLDPGLLRFSLRTQSTVAAAPSRPPEAAP